MLAALHEVLIRKTGELNEALWQGEVAAPLQIEVLQVPQLSKAFGQQTGEQLV